MDGQASGIPGGIDYRWTCYCMQGQILWHSHLPDVTCQGAVDSAQDHAGCSPGSPCQVISRDSTRPDRPNAAVNHRL
jgi:hypothetical protein